MNIKSLYLAALVTLFSLPVCIAQNKNLKEHLTFYASFDKTGEADFALGDPNIFTSPTRREKEKAQVGLHDPNVVLTGDEGKFGGALEFKEKSRMLTFFKSKHNINYNETAWTGTISFWLKLDPEKDLEPGYCDPIQITDVNYNDASIWVDFTKDNPRQFRLGVLGDLSVWNPKNLPPDQNQDYIDRLIIMKQHPFSGTKWTQVTITYANLGQPDGEAKLYIDGELHGTEKNIDVPFTWELEKSNIMLGLNYIGLMDELCVFNKTFDAKEVKSLYNLKKGIRSIL
ncbi:MAG: LamG-like jellyroll fold domain-containing protein [Bacteroidota bacterium]